MRPKIRKSYCLLLWIGTRVDRARNVQNLTVWLLAFKEWIIANEMREAGCE